MTQFGKAKHIHFVGIGGIGMSGLAELLINLGYRVSGSDLKQTAVIRRLDELGCTIFKGHNDTQMEGADVVVYSSAVPQNNPEISRAHDLKVPVIPRAELLAEMMRLKYGIAVAGAHGKTTTTSMVASILTVGGLDPTVVIGGRLDIWGGSNAKMGQGDILVAEADESDGSFMVLSPTMAVVTNIDQEHMDHYGSMDALRNTFIDFVNKIPFYGTAILCLDNEPIQGILPKLKKRCLTYGMNSQADLRALDLEKEIDGTAFEAVYQNRALGRITVGLPGDHNVLNALAAVAVGLELDLDMDTIQKGLGTLGGVSRRFEIKQEKRGLLLIDDYGHHPTEIVATLETAKNCWPERRLIVLFQPHRYTRTRDLFDRFALSFNDADILMIGDIYAAGETPIEGVSAEGLCQEIKAHGHKEVFYYPDEEALYRLLLPRIRKGDVLMTLGAGDIHKTGDRILERLCSGGKP